MDKRFPQYDELDLPKVAKEVLQQWEAEDTFGQSLELRKDAPPFVFYEGPPSANGLPGIHHVMARTIKDIFCRYQTQKGHRVDRKAGWDTHGLPIELGVEKELGITKEDIGKKISIEEYNAACKKAVMRYTDVWNDLTKRIGFWLDLEHPYVTYHTKYIESVWYLLKKLYDDDLLYKGYTIQPYSPAAGTGLSSHELNQPGTYKPVKDTSAVALFKVIRDQNSEWLFSPSPREKGPGDEGVFIMAWTTTPWTLPSNTALTVGPKLEYVRVKTFNPYTHAPQTVVLAKARLNAYFKEETKDASFDDYKKDGKNIPWTIVGEFLGHQLEGVRYEQLLPYAEPEGGGDAFKVIGGDFVTTEDGTGVVHTAPSFGADDQRVARQHNIGSLTLVDLRGRFKPEVTDFAGEYVKAEYYTAEELAAEAKKQGRDKYLSVDERIAIKLKTEGRAFKVEKYEHNYPHCWRTDKPVLYYPLDSWFVRVTAKKDRLIALNKTITWKPESTGTGRFGNWLENLQDWNLSRSRYWGIPLPIWRTEDGGEELCIGSLKQLKEEIARAVKAGVMKEDPYASFQVDDLSDANYDRVDIHRPFVDHIVLVSPSGKPMKRETDLIDVWFDSGAMPYAQWHYPFENEATFKEKFPAAFIAEGVDQTRGWFYTLHAISTLVFDQVAYKTVVSNGLVLDKVGQKMSKRLGNAVDPFTTLDQYGADAVRWYMISNASPWDNLKFDAEGITEVQRKFFRALFNTYNFFALYANIDGYDGKGEATLTESDRWVLSRLNSVMKVADTNYGDYEPTIAARTIQDFVVEDLSNWYVRLNRRRFWKGDALGSARGGDKNAAYQTLHRCLEVVAMLSAPIAPFFSDRLYRDLHAGTPSGTEGVHLSDWPKHDERAIDLELEQRTSLAQKLTSLVLSIRKKEGHRVRQPLQKMMVPVTDAAMRTRLDAIRDLVLSEVNVKELVILDASESKLTKKIKPDFKKLGARMGKLMKSVANAVNAFDQAQIAELEAKGSMKLMVDGQEVELLREDVEITAENVPGLSVASDGALTVALDITLTDALIQEGIARELVSRIQTLRKESGLEVTDRIELRIQRNGDPAFERAVKAHAPHILAETLALTAVDQLMVADLSGAPGTVHQVELDERLTCALALAKQGI
ncbi:MAG TPA: isoleucine--tRNA ligase [Flavobacteriales bacterium]|nr:isoleucine--tRNA ligase [Flavobacteriales bacterium]HMU14952.1 isoleucine--tRNA ligase [Flavobacteriales bacterium]HMW95929.1 isoleucine--tRNA ligase [Flavobacteriales bacterium]HNI03151.1 isoleucine--tRNA ligase [Flavobacteriales bacterium]HNK83945.1 isoleucine--tRNA ligase [Flavobacteriales bacterium]